MMSTTFDKTFLGTGWAFPPRFDGPYRRARMVSHEDDIRESLHILFSTTPGERVMQPAYGCGLKKKVFAHIDANAITEIKDMIEKAVLFFEVRIALNGIDIDTSELFDGVLRILLDYTVRTTNTRNNMVYPFYFRQGTGLRLVA
jgi:phage baseplate assembly protein W